MPNFQLAGEIRHSLKRARDANSALDSALMAALALAPGSDLLREQVNRFLLEASGWMQESVDIRAMYSLPFH